MSPIPANCRQKTALEALPMSKQPPAEEQLAQQQAKAPPAQRPAEQNKQQPAQHVSETTSAAVVDQVRAGAKQKPAMQKEQQKVTAGRAGEAQYHGGMDPGAHRHPHVGTVQLQDVAR